MLYEWGLHENDESATTRSPQACTKNGRSRTGVSANLAGATVLLNWGLGKRLFGGNPSILNQAIYVDAQPYTSKRAQKGHKSMPFCTLKLWTGTAIVVATSRARVNAAKAAAWKEVERLDIQQLTKPQTGGTVRSVISRYEAERMPSRHSTARVYRSFLNNHILPEWGDKAIGTLQPRPVELWLRELPLSPKSKTHVRSLLHGLVELSRNSRTPTLSPPGRRLSVHMERRIANHGTKNFPSKIRVGEDSCRSCLDRLEMFLLRNSNLGDNPISRYVTALSCPNRPQ